MDIIITFLVATDINSFDNAEVRFSHNYPMFNSAILTVLSVTWNMHSNANIKIITFEDNKVDGSGYIVRLGAANINGFDKAELINFSCVFHCVECEISIEESKMLIINK